MTPLAVEAINMTMVEILELERKHNQQKLESEISQRRYERQQEKMLEQVNIAVLTNQIAFYKALST